MDPHEEKTPRSNRPGFIVIEEAQRKARLTQTVFLLVYGAWFVGWAGMGRAVGLRWQAIMLAGPLAGWFAWGLARRWRERRDERSGQI